VRAGPRRSAGLNHSMRASASLPARPGRIGPLGRVAVFALAVWVGSAMRGAETASERGLPALRNFAPRVYGGNDQVWKAVATRDGLMYFGTDGQVIEFDGQSWRGIPVPNGSHLRGLAVDRDDVVWVGGVNQLGRIAPGPDGRRSFTSLRNLVPGTVGDLKDIWAVYATDEGVWFQSNQAVLRWRDGKFDVWMMGERAIVLSFWLGDHLLVARTNGWFRPMAGGRWEALGKPEAKLGDYLPHFALPHSAGGWLMGLEGPHGEVTGLARWDGTQLTPEPHPLDEYFKTKRFYGATRLSDGRTVVTTLQGGAVVLGPHLEFQTLLNEKAGLASDVVISATEDTYGAVWLGTEFGISRMQLHPAYTWFSAVNGLTRGSSHPIVRWHGQVLVGTTQGLMRYETPAETPGNGRLARWSAVDDKVHDFAEVGDDLMIGCVGGLWVLHDTTATKVDRLSNIFAMHASRAQPDRLLVASLNGLVVYRRDGAKWARERVFSEVRPNSLEEMPDGSVWVGTDTQGVWRVRWPPPGAEGEAKPSFTRYGAEAGLPAGGRTGLVAVRGTPLVLTTEGLRRFDAAAQRFQPDPAFGRRFTDGSTIVRQIAPDEAGGAWIVAQPAGLLDPAELQEVGYARGETWQQLPLPDSTLLDGHGDIYVERADEREILWMNGESAFLRVDLTAWRATAGTKLGATLIREVTTPAGRLVPAATAGAGLTLRARDNSVRFHFGTPGLAGDPNARHETRLLGFERGEAEITAASERTLTNLPAGRYVFEVRGRSGDGRWSEAAALAFTVLAPWWQTVWAWLGYGLGLAAAIYAIVVRRTRLLEGERTRLEAVVALRTTELAQKNHALERLNRVEQDEKLAARLAEEKARLELLRYQLNPHFLFNSLNSIRALVYAKPEAAGEMVTRLAEFCRWTLTRGSDEITTVAEEMEMIRAYLEIEKARWQEALVTRVEVGPEASAERLPQFLLLPLIENAIKYGGRTSPSTLEVVVSARIEGDFLCCEVANTGAWVEPEARPTPMSTHIGLENLRQRLARHYGAGCELEIGREAGWVRMRLRLKRGLSAIPRPAPARDPFNAP
jgi:signal transduction histidine kinase